MYYQTPTLDKFEDLKSFAEKNIDKLSETQKSFQKKFDRFRID